MESNGNYTVDEVVELTIRTLSNINVPVGLMGQIGKPIEQAISYLKAVQDAWEQEKQRKAHEEEPVDEPAEETSEDE